MTSAAKSLLQNWALVVLACISVAAVVVTRDSITSSELLAREHHLFPSFEEELVQRIEFQGEPALTITRGNEQTRFLIVAPFQAEAEEATVDQLLRSLRFAAWLREVPSDAIDRATLGLNPAQQIVKLNHGERHYELHLGTNAQAPEGARYVEVWIDGEVRGVYVVSASTARELSPKLADFRVQRLFPYAEAELQSLTLSHGQQATELRRSAQGVWSFKDRFSNARLDRAATDRLFLQFSRVSAEDFLPLEEAEGVQAKNQELVTVKLQPGSGGGEASLTLGGACPKQPGKVIAVRQRPEPIAACFNSDVERAFIEHPELLLDQKAFQLRLDEAEQVRIVRGDSVLEFARRGDGFILRLPQSGDVERGAGEARLQALLELRGDWLDGASLPAPFEAALRVTLTKGAAREEDVVHEEIEVQLPAAGEERAALLLRRVSDGALLRVDASAARVFAIDALLLKSRNILDLAADALKQVTVEWGGQKQTVKQPHRGAFELSEPAGFEVDGGLAADLFDGLRQLRASTWVSENKEPSFGLESPQLRCRFSYEGHAEERELLLGEAAPEGGFFASLDGGSVFVVPRAFRDLLTTWVVDRSVLMLPTEELEGLRVEARGQKLELVRLGASFVQRSGNVSLGPGRITELLDAFSLLRVEGLVAPTKATKDHGLDAPSLRVSAQLRPDALNRAVTRSFSIGSADTFGDVAVYYAFRDDMPAVFALPRESVRRILELF